MPVRGVAKEAPALEKPVAPIARHGDTAPQSAEIIKSNENPQLPTQTGAARRDPVAARRIGQDARTALQEVQAEWGGPGVGEDEAALQTGSEAQIAAACLGTKPLYIEPWGQELSEKFARALKVTLPAGVTVEAAEGHLLIYRPEIVRPILDSDAAFYRRAGENDAAAIARLSAAGENGELLGYGSRNFLDPKGARVLVTTETGVGYMWFISKPELAEIFAAERAQDIQDYTGLPVNIQITYR